MTKKSGRSGFRNGRFSKLCPVDQRVKDFTFSDTTEKRVESG